MLTRRQFLVRTGAASLGLNTALLPVRSQEDTLPDGSAAKNMITPATQKAIDLGLAFLARSQHSDGSWGTGQYESNVAVSSLAALAMMAGGHQPSRGAYGPQVLKALEYTLSQEEE